MTREQYIRITQPYRENPGKAKFLRSLNKLLAGIIFMGYPLALLMLFLQTNPLLLRAILVPLDGFIAVSVFRWVVNKPRPYEAFELPPIIPKETKGKSFPSRHVFSAAVIAGTLCFIPGFAGVGIIFLAVSGILGWIRVVTGIHYPADVAAGIGMAAAVVVIGFVVIP